VNVNTGAIRNCDVKDRIRGACWTPEHDSRAATKRYNTKHFHIRRRLYFVDLSSPQQLNWQRRAFLC